MFRLKPFEKIKPTPLLLDTSILLEGKKYNLRSHRIHENVKMKQEQIELALIINTVFNKNKSNKKNARIQWLLKTGLQAKMRKLSPKNEPITARKYIKTKLIARFATFDLPFR